MKILIVDDEKIARENCQMVLSLSGINELVVREADSVASALKEIADFDPDLLLLDIQLHDKSGFEILQTIAPRYIPTIFITAYNDFALKAFQVSALDYLLKPFDPSELIAALLKAHKRIQNDKILEQLDVFRQQFSPEEPKRIVLNTADVLHIAAIDDITYCLADGAYTHFFFVDRKEILVSKTLAHFEGIINSTHFIRTHQSYLVNMRHVTQFDKRNGGFLILPNGIEIPVSTRKKEEVLAHFKGSH
ncbi:LytR/AlgR family response regulator transcription factor [Fluviicola taffensis]|uniref:Two component transcriptional regulator, LytTR family n=1 Tax=Fluviicola taffensis (strain DSM 16823 / NCIMB 13979 / RW262) TaxID=755732 RepID=F2IFZ5_FLUTR|nr:LytTR family DNA-binding domain-containing protein [Fluviicola taffensis]AEA43616.1 two component transcriptional regulator, LytTR family [Fluviicola taffensis DSM 16823]